VSGRNEQKSNFAYFPILVEDSFPLSRDELYDLLQKHSIHARRYFYPLICEFSMYRGMPSSNPRLLPEAHYASSRIICLPIYPDLSLEKLNLILSIILEVGNQQLRKIAA